MPGSSSVAGIFYCAYRSERMQYLAKHIAAVRIAVGDATAFPYTIARLVTAYAVDYFCQGQYKRSLKGAGMPRGIAYDKESHEVFVTADNKITTFHLSTGNQIRQVSTYGMLYGICVLPSKRLALCDASIPGIGVFDFKGSMVRSVNWTVEGAAPRGICYDDETGNLYVTDSVGNCVVFSTLLNKLWDFGGPGDEDGQMECPSDVVLDAENKCVIITDRWTHRLQWFTKAGLHIRTVGSRGSGIGEFTYPYAVALHGPYLYVSDEDNCRIVVLQRENGRYVGEFGSRGTENGFFHGPSGLCVVGNTLLVADHRNQRVQLFT